MQREIPGWVEEMDRRGVRLLGRPLNLPETAATVRVRDGETLVTDGPFAETREQLGGYALIEAKDMDEAIRIAGAFLGTSSPVMIEIRAVAEVKGLPTH